MLTVGSTSSDDLIAIRNWPVWSDATKATIRVAVAVMLDGTMNFVWLEDDPPPDDDSYPTMWVVDSPPPNEHWSPAPGMQTCINRHDGGLNALFLDWSARKVGLKELWTLKWARDYNTRGRWTKAGGAKPEDWPQWLRRFKDY